MVDLGSLNMPVSGFKLRIESVLEFWCPQSSHFPEGSMAKWRGVFPPHGACWRKVSFPVLGSR